MPRHEPGTVLFRRYDRTSVSGPGHVVVAYDASAVRMITTTGDVIVVNAADFAGNFVEVPGVVADDLRAARRELADLELRSERIRQALALAEGTTSRAVGARQNQGGTP